MTNAARACYTRITQRASRGQGAGGPRRCRSDGLALGRPAVARRSGRLACRSRPAPAPGQPRPGRETGCTPTSPGGHRPRTRSQRWCPPRTAQPRHRGRRPPSCRPGVRRGRVPALTESWPTRETSAAEFVADMRTCDGRVVTGVENVHGEHASHRRCEEQPPAQHQPTGPPRWSRRHGPTVVGDPGSRSRLSSRALTATMRLDPDIVSAAISGRSTRPNAGSNTPAAIGSAIAL